MSSSTANFLFELGTEELPPKALKNLSSALTRGVVDRLKQHMLAFDEGGVQSFAAPRRLAVLVPALQTQQPDQSIEKLGPAIAAAYDKEGKPSKAAEGFARSNGVSFDELITVETDKGERLCYRSTAKGKAAAELLPDIISQALADLPIPKRMRWGASRDEFVRPAHWLLMLLGGDVIETEILGLTAGKVTLGHRFHAPAEITIDDALQYEALLEEQGKVLASFEKRREHIVAQTRKLAASLGAQAVIEDDLLDEVTALVEWPVALAGKFDEAFLAVPEEALVSSMSEHQKYFHLLDDAGQLLPGFITISNIECDDPARIIEGNERVIRPRLADAAFFFETDKKVSLQSLRKRLQNVVFQQKLGTVYEKTSRIAALAESIARLLGVDGDQARRAGELCKADLASDLVLEFDKMQGIAGGYYARHESLGDEIATAIETHYLPRFAGDKVPETDIACAVAIADRLDTITGIFGIGQEPSGSKDPFALRRASIGVLQIILHNKLAVNLRELITAATGQHAAIEDRSAVVDKVCSYIFDRFTAYYQEQGISTEVIMAVRAVSAFDALDFDARIHAVTEFVAQPECESLAAANKRVSNILEKSEGVVTADTFDAGLLAEEAEKTLADAINASQAEAAPLFKNGDYRAGLLALTKLRKPIDTFFDKVMVNTDDPALKQNRLALLATLRDMFMQAADVALLAPAKK